MMTLRTMARVGSAVALLMLIGSVPGSVHAEGRGDEKASTYSPARPADPDYTAGVKAIKASEFAKAIPLLQAASSRDATNADAYNWLAYAVRKNGDVRGSIPIYQKALAIDPKHRGAHEYIGEAYLMLGDVAKAKEHLAALDSLCFLPCSEYRDLKKAVQAYEKNGGTAKP